MPGKIQQTIRVLRYLVSTDLFEGSSHSKKRRSSARKRALGFESLEVRQLLAAVYPTNYEQYQVELINRARAAPATYASGLGISLNEGLPAGTISSTPKAPLAINPNLTDSAQKHSQWMIDTDKFSHTGAAGKGPQQRMIDAGYAFTGSWMYSENIGWQGTTATPNVLAMTKSIEESLFVDKNISGRGHRVNILKESFSEVGVGIRSGGFRSGTTTYNAVMATQEFVKSGTGVFLTGVAFADTVAADRFYTPGEGLRAISIVAVRDTDGARYSTTTWASGGYSLALPAGRYNVTASGAGLAATQFIPGVTLGTKNVKIDFIKGTVRTAPEVDVLNGVTTVPDGTGVVAFGNAVRGSTALTRTLTVKNNGNAPLTMSSATLTGAGFTIVTNVPATLAAGASANLVVRFDTAVAGVKSVVLSFANNDSNENPYNFTLTGTVTAPAAVARNIATYRKKGTQKT